MNEPLKTVILIIICFFLFMLLAFSIHQTNLALMEEEQDSCEGHFVQYADYNPDTGEVIPNQSNICVESDE